MSDEDGDGDEDEAAELPHAHPRLKPRLVDHDPIQVCTPTEFAEHPAGVDQ